MKQNLHTYAKHVLVFKNTGTHTIEDKSWKIYFHHIRIVEPKIDMIDDRYQHNILLGQSGLRVSHVSGLLYNIFPDEDLYKPLKPSEELSVPIMSSHFQLSKTDSFPNWYVTGPNLAPQIIKSTEGEELEFVSSFNHPDQWKRSKEDEHNPYTAKDRYNMSKHSFKDLAKTRKTIIPTPEEVRVSEKFVVFDASEWVILSSVDFPSEVQFLAGKQTNNNLIKKIFVIIILHSDQSSKQYIYRFCFVFILTSDNGLCKYVALLCQPRFK